MAQNYHRHSSYSNIMTPDSTVANEDYAKRAVELGHKVLSSVEHGFQGNYYQTYELAKKYNLKFIFGTEAYWVKDRLEKDKTNSHIIILAKNEEGRRDINNILSEANITGYYFKPRVDIDLLLSLNPDNVFVTTACLAFWRYEDIDKIALKLKNHFNSNFMLEVQYHNTLKQKTLNKKILELSRKYNIDIIAGYDSHYIKETDDEERNNYLEAREMNYEDEQGWFLDYPSDEIAFIRFQQQGILNDEEIFRAMNNTNILLSFEDISFNNDIKLPTLYPNKSQEWKDNLLKKIINTEWKDNVVKTIDVSKKQEYIEGIKYEINAITETKMTDYFLLDYELVKKGREKGGIISLTSRGSGGSYYVNSLLGFSNLDRFISPVKLYPDRFMSKTRILLTRSLPDLDLNLGTPEIFADAQKELLGDNHAYPMIAFGKLKVASAFKMYAKSQGLDFETANEISKQIKKYESDLKHADTEEEKEMINVYDYVEEKYHKYIDESKKYQGIINTKVSHPCGWLIYQGDIRKEIGLIKCKSESTGKETITTVIDGSVAENYKFVKNDLLKVDVWLTIFKIFDTIGIKPYSINEITKLVEDDENTWNIYKNGYTLGVNQMESNFGKQCCKRYKPQSIKELTALVSALRPGFKSMLENFLERKEYTTGVKSLDDLLEDSFHYIMYQENIMTYLGWLGIPQTETYEIIKKISKKKFKEKELQELKQRLLQAWILNTGNEEGFEKTFKIMEDFSLYAFNASHAYAYAYDSVYGAYLKAHHPYEFYSVMLQNLSDKGKKDKIIDYKKEMFDAFEIKEGKYKYGLDNRNFTIDKDNQSILPSLVSIKDMSQEFANELWEVYQQHNNIENLYDLFTIIYSMKTSNKTKVQGLVDIGYFEDYGNLSQIYRLNRAFYEWKDSKIIKKSNIADCPFSEELIKKHSKETDKQYSCNMEELLRAYFDEVLNTKVNEIIILDVAQNNPTFNPTIKVLDTKDNQNYVLRINVQQYNEKPIKKYDSIRITSKNSKPKSRRIDGKWVKFPDELESWVTYEVVKYA